MKRDVYVRVTAAPGAHHGNTEQNAAVENQQVMRIWQIWYHFKTGLFNKSEICELSPPNVPMQ